MSETNTPSDPRGAADGRKPYTPPRLIAYGHVKDIVQGATGSKADSGTTKQTGPPCWVAEALYGVDDPRTLVLRAWLMDVHARKGRGWQWVSLYAAIGQRVAALVRRAAPLRFALRALFDALAERAFDHRARSIADERHRRPI
jgi:hypothetical protein